MKYRTVLLALFIPVVLYGVPTDELPTEYYHRLKQLKTALEPKPVTMVKIGNMNQGKKIVSPGLLFTYKNRNAHTVKIAGNFSKWRLKPMDRSQHGVWYFFLESSPKNDVILYKFYVDGTWIMDPENPLRRDDGIGSYISLMDQAAEPEGTHLTYRIIKKNTIEFRIYRPGARIISLVGDFNHWNPENDLLSRDSRGIWRIVKRIPRGTYRYKYVIDGRWETDIFNERSASDSNGEVCSLIEVR